ncbi:MAG: hypothetical protein GTN86_08940 [Xanthomonadales bacterium]|nr:hypothetical protein [Xanthomonadales bacterium]NIN60010.1 hypothetical protein [Xanthomonadales bacterium]NIN75378.1 hypothetical protein [Xanthomonadales bacterium]NIO14201.1 hypothetical protein [Xanthomonadales bacterium]NIP12403.1 hypothetical protein [Xanthomonadales bacterium]
MIKSSRPLCRLAGLLLAVLLASGCATDPKATSLDETLLQYETVIRWSQWDAALDFLAPEHLSEHPITPLDMERLRLFRVTQYTVRSAVPMDEGTRVQQVVEIRMFNKNRAVERSVMDRQEWHWNEERQRWFLHSGLPDVTQAR